MAKIVYPEDGLHKTIIINFDFRTKPEKRKSYNAEGRIISNDNKMR